MAELESLNKIQAEFSDYVEAAAELERENKQLRDSLNEAACQAASLEKKMKGKFENAKREWRKQSLDYADKRERRLRELLDETVAKLMKSQFEHNKYKAFFQEQTKKATLVMLDYNKNDKHVAILNMSGDPMDLAGYSVRFSSNCSYSFSSSVLKGGESLSLWWGEDKVGGHLDENSYHFAMDPPDLGNSLSLMKGGTTIATCLDSSSSSSSTSSDFSGEGKIRGKGDIEIEERIATKKQRVGGENESNSSSVVAPRQKEGSEHMREICGRFFVFDDLRKGLSLKLQHVIVSPTEVTLAFENRGSLPISINSGWKVMLLSPSQVPVSCPCGPFIVPGNSQSEIKASLPDGIGQRKFTHVALHDGIQCRSASDTIIHKNHLGRDSAPEPAGSSCTIS